MLIYLEMIESEEDRSKFERLYELYRGLMFYVAQNILHNESDAEDAVHQAFIAILENLNKIGEIDCPKTRSFSVIIAERKAIDIIRKSSRLVTIDAETLEAAEIPLPGDGGLADAMARLPARYREVLLLRYDNGYTAKEIARLFGIKPGSVQKLLYRAKRALQERLEKEMQK